MYLKVMILASFYYRGKNNEIDLKSTDASLAQY